MNLRAKMMKRMELESYHRQRRRLLKDVELPCPLSRWSRASKEFVIF